MAERFGIQIGSDGWPCRALHWERWYVQNQKSPRSSEDLPRDTWWLSGIFLPTGNAYPRLLDVRRLPLRPIWPGFLVNTLFYAAVLWLLICGPFALRRFVRVKHGLCPACAYPIGESGVCSECGGALP